MLESYKWMGWMGWDCDWKSLQALILRAPLCGAKNHPVETKEANKGDSCGFL